MKKLLTSFLLICLFVSCSDSKVKNRQIFIEEFNWKITVPEGFEYMSEKEVQATRNKGLNLLEEKLGEEIEDITKVIFWIQNGELNGLEANFQPFDIQEDGDYKESNDYINKFSVEALTSKYPQIQVDSLTSFEKIDDLNFQKFYAKFTYPNGMIFYTHSYSHLFGNKDFTVSITYLDEKIGEKMLESFRKSKFTEE